MSKKPPDAQKEQDEFFEDLDEELRKFRLPFALKLVREVTAIVVWMALFVQLFFFDIAHYLSAQNELIQIAIKYSFFILILVLPLTWIVFGNRRFYLFFPYIAFYPLVLVVWKMPIVLSRNWGVVLTFLPAIHATFETFKLNLLLFSLGACAALIIFESQNPYMIWAGITYLVLYLAIHYIRRFKRAFSNNTVFTTFSENVVLAFSHANKSLEDRRKNVVGLTAEELDQRHRQNIMQLYVFSSGAVVLGEKLKEIKESRKLDVYLISTILYSFALTTLLFALCFFGIERALPHSFAGITSPNFFNFLGFSFGTLMTHELSALSAVGFLAIIATYAELFCTLLLLTLLVFAFQTSVRERYSHDLDLVVDNLEKIQKYLSGEFHKHYEISLQSAEKFIVDVEPVFGKFLLWFRYGKEGAKKVLIDLSKERDISGEEQAKLECSEYNQPKLQDNRASSKD